MIWRKNLFIPGVRYRVLAAIQQPRSSIIIVLFASTIVLGSQTFAEQEFPAPSPIQVHRIPSVPTNATIHREDRQNRQPAPSETINRDEVIVRKVPISPPSASGPTLSAAVAKPVVKGDAILVKLTLRNGLSEAIESARAAVFVTDENGKLVAQSARWVVGGAGATVPLASGSTNHFNFVLRTKETSSSTNLTAQLSFSRLVLQGGKVADPMKDVRIVSE